MAIFLPDDIDRLFWQRFGTVPISAPPDLIGGAGGPSTPVLRQLCRKPGTPGSLPGVPAEELKIPVWFWSHEMRHRVEKEYPSIWIQAFGLNLVNEMWGQWIDTVTQVLANGNLVVRQAPLWYDLKWQVTCAAITYQLINELTWDVQNGVFPWLLGERFFKIEGINRRIVMAPRGIQYQEDPHVYRTTTDFTLRIPLFVDGGAGQTVEEVPIEDVCILLRRVGVAEDILEDISLDNQSVLKFVAGSDSVALAELGVPE